MHQALKLLLDIQELDIKMIRLMRVKKQRQGELKQIEDLRVELEEQLKLKQEEIADLDKQINALEEKIQELSEKYKKLETQQSSIKKVEEFNALTQEMTAVEREKGALETQTSNILDKKVAEEEIYDKIKSSLEASAVNSQELENEIKLGIDKINEEGQQLKEQRQEAAKNADPEVLKIYERLLRNKKDRVIVPIENRTCSGCHIALTLQHENLVRKGEALVFCEHCSRIHYWQESESIEGTTVATRRRRRRTVKT
ncbi:zinc ribbon domain regulatory protein CdsZ [Simkania sp.]|uniref:zinc ribbon domain regulatory protein CdsZ n=1 Tax=Simkania sp. TaxID=34094 RepID=UPI003B52B72B